MLYVQGSQDNLEGELCTKHFLETCTPTLELAPLKVTTKGDDEVLSYQENATLQSEQEIYGTTSDSKCSTSSNTDFSLQNFDNSGTRETQNLTITEFLAQYSGKNLPDGSDRMLTFGESSEEEFENGKLRSKPRQINLEYPDNMWPPHFHPHNQEWRVRYRFKGAMRIRTVSCKQFGLEGAKLLALAFVDRWTKSGRPLSAKTKRSKLCVLDILNQSSIEKTDAANDSKVRKSAAYKKEHGFPEVLRTFRREDLGETHTPQYEGTKSQISPLLCGNTLSPKTLDYMRKKESFRRNKESQDEVQDISNLKVSHKRKRASEERHLFRGCRNDIVGYGGKVRPKPQRIVLEIPSGFKVSRPQPTGLYAKSHQNSDLVFDANIYKANTYYQPLRRSHRRQTLVEGKARSRKLFTRNYGNKEILHEDGKLLDCDHTYYTKKNLREYEYAGSIEKYLKVFPKETPSDGKLFDSSMLLDPECWCQCYPCICADYPTTTWEEYRSEWEVLTGLQQALQNFDHVHPWGQDSPSRVFFSAELPTPEEVASMSEF